MEMEPIQPDDLQALPTDDLDALWEICVKFVDYDNAVKRATAEHETYVNWLALVLAFAETRKADVGKVPEIQPDPLANVQNIASYLIQLHGRIRTDRAQRDSRRKLAQKREQYIAVLSSFTVYEFSDTEFSRAQQLINELRGL